MKKILTIILLVSGCNFGLNKELDSEEAETLIHYYAKYNSIDSTLLKKSHASHIVVKNDIYLFVVNSFNGDFNGWIYSENGDRSFINLVIKPFIITGQEQKIGNWTKVYGKY